MTRAVFNIVNAARQQSGMQMLSILGPDEKRYFEDKRLCEIMDIYAG